MIAVDDVERYGQASSLARPSGRSLVAIGTVVRLVATWIESHQVGDELVFHR